MSQLTNQEINQQKSIQQKIDISLIVDSEKPLSSVEKIKINSRNLRGTLTESLANRITRSIADDDTQLIKFHGSYQQDDRDLRQERARQKLEPAYSYMIRARVPGGVCTPAQWIAMDDISDLYANGSVRLTTRQAIQLHGVIKDNLDKSLKHMQSVLMDSIAACGDVNRNIMCNPNSNATELHQVVYQHAVAIGEHLLPKSRAYHEIWLDGEKLVDSGEEFEPIYGKTYLPRKFKIGVAIPPVNDVDIYSQDLGFIAIIENNQLLGYNITVGGGMGTSHSDPNTFARLADTIGFCSPEQVIAVAEHVVKVQRDFGGRSSRSHARLKYTIAQNGVEWFKNELNSRLGFELVSAKNIEFLHRGDQFGWQQSFDGLWHSTLYIENGRVRDLGNQLLRSGLRKIALIHQGDFRITPNQNLIIANVTEKNKSVIEALIKQYQLDKIEGNNLLHKNALACVALPTCTMAMAEAERYLSTFLSKVDELLTLYQLQQQPMTIRITGCPNGCARPFLAEIALVGKAPGRYNLHLGGSFNGDRLNELFKQNLNEQQILNELDGLFKSYANNKNDNESIGDFVQRTQWIQKFAE